MNIQEVNLRCGAAPRFRLHCYMYRLFLDHALTILGFCLALFLIARIRRQNYRPSVSWAWFLAIILIPYVGVPAYLLFGGRKISHLAKRKRMLYQPRPQDVRAAECLKNNAESIFVSAGLPPARRQNKLEFIPDGVRAYQEVMRMIEGAKETIDIETYLLGKDEVGRSIVDLLAKKAREGVRVRVLIDAFGVILTKGIAVEELKEAGGEVALFNPVLPVRAHWSANLRNHRKIMIVDFNEAMIGGMNLSGDYMGPRPDSKRWLDSTMLVQGPATTDLAEIFCDDWEYATGEPFDLETLRQMRPKVTEDGDGGVAQVVASGPDIIGEPLYEAILSESYDSLRRLWILIPYFIPDMDLFRALALQARLGCDLRIIVPRRSNHYIADLARGRALRDLRMAGARIYFYKEMLHAKHVLFDDRIAVTGSANLDTRSLILNYEVAMFLYSRPEIETTAEWMEEIMAQSVEVEEMKRGYFKELAEDAAMLLSPLL